MNLRKEINKVMREQASRSWTGLAGLDKDEALFEEPVTVSNFFEQDAVDDTDISGPGVETAIDELIENFSNYIDQQIPEKYKNVARQAVKVYWIQKLKDWNELRTGE